MIDLETTGFYRTDRVVEIAIVTLDGSGAVVDEWVTLVDPGRDVGPTHVHGIAASDVCGAPTFSMVAGDIAERLHGAVLVAHNLFGFDARMLLGEFDRIEGCAVSLGWGVDTLRITRTRLPVACSNYGVPIDGWHSALADARATAHLLRLVLSEHNGPIEPASLTGMPPRRTRCQHRRSVGLSERPLVSRLVDAAASTCEEVDEVVYLDLLSRVVQDWRVTPAERAALDSLAEELSMDSISQRRAHARFVESLTEVALSDGIVTQDELDHLAAVCHLLGVDPTEMVSRTAHARGSRSKVELSEGMTVCFTGSAVYRGQPVSRAELTERARELGMHSTSSVSGITDLVVAADVASQSGKAKRARELGVPVVSVDDFLAARPGDVIVSHVTSSQKRRVAECSRCGRAIVGAPSGRRAHHCAECHPPASRAPTGTAPVRSGTCQGG